MSAPSLGETVTCEALSGGAPIVVLAPHPDDESLGCGALLAGAFAMHGAHVFCLTDGSGSHPGSRHWSAARLASRRAAELLEAITHLGGTGHDVTWLGITDGQLSEESAVGGRRLADLFVDHCRRFGVRSLFAPSELDHHADHRASAAIGRTIAAHLPDLRLFWYPVWSRHDDPTGLMSRPGWRYHRLPLEPWTAHKRRAVMAHRSQLGLVVVDDPDGFVLPGEMLERFLNEDELYIETEEGAE